MTIKFGPLGRQILFVIFVRRKPTKHFNVKTMAKRFLSEYNNLF